MPKVVSIDEEKKKHRDEWLLFEVTVTNEFDCPTRGRLLCHSKDRSEVHRAEMEVLEKDTFIFFTGEPVPPGIIPVL